MASRRRKEKARDVFDAALTLSKIRAIAPESWQDTRNATAATAKGMEKGTERPENIVVFNAMGAVILGPDTTGLQTCLYVGNDDNLQPVQTVLTARSCASSGM